ncbi:MAG: hypothetical protein ABIE22_02645 [archaeon]
MKPEEDDVVLCTVNKVVGTSVFLDIEGNGEGTMVTSEIAPGRIRNLRDYVVPNKKIVCKVLKIDSSGHINLSLRRVTTKEKNKVLEAYKQEKNAISILKTVLKVKCDEIVKKIQAKSTISEFLQVCKENPQELDKYMDKQEAEKVCKILSEKREKEVEVKKTILLKSKDSNGIEVIKTILSTCRGNCSTAYIAAGKFQIKIKSKDYKQANVEVLNTLQSIEKIAKEKGAEFQILEKK